VQIIVRTTKIWWHRCCFCAFFSSSAQLMSIRGAWWMEWCTMDL